MKYNSLEISFNNTCISSSATNGGFFKGIIELFQGVIYAESNNSIEFGLNNYFRDNLVVENGGSFKNFFFFFFFIK